MKMKFKSVVCFLLLAGLVAAQSKPKFSGEAVKAGGLEAEVLKASEQFDEARKAKDKAGLQRVLADQLTWIARGERLGKAQVIADFLSGGLQFISFAHDSVTVQVFRSTAVVSGHSTSVLEFKGKRFDAPRLFSDVWMKMDGRWQMVAHHVSELPKP
jgi:hypothetical protein